MATSCTRMGRCQPQGRTEAAGGRTFRRACSSFSKCSVCKPVSIGKCRSWRDDDSGFRLCYRGKKRADFIHWCFISVLSKEFGCGSNTFWNANYTQLCHPTSLIHDMLFLCKSVIAHVLCTCVVMVSDCFLNLLLNCRSTLPFPGSQEHYEVCGFHSQSIQHWLELCIRCLYYALIRSSRCSSRVWWGICLARQMMCSLKANGRDLLNYTPRP